MASILARFLRSAGVLMALGGSIIPSLRFLSDGAWLNATLASFFTYYALMRPATAAHARLTPVLSEHG